MEGGLSRSGSTLKDASARGRAGSSLPVYAFAPSDHCGFKSIMSSSMAAPRDDAPAAVGLVEVVEKT